MLQRILITSAVAFAAVSCGSYPVSEQTGFSNINQPASESGLSSQQKGELVLPFALACSPANGGTQLRSVRVLFDGSSAELRRDSRGNERDLTSTSSKLLSVTADTIDVSWPLDQVSFKAARQYGRVFKGELTQGNDVVTLNCYKIVTSDRDSDEFTLACTPMSPEQAGVEDLNLTVHDVVLSWEDNGLEMIVNPTLESQIFDFERADDVQVNDYEVSATWNLELASFSAKSLDGIRFDGQLSYEGQSAIPLICWKL